ncbi:MAG: hypothetical protein ABEJ98_05160 [Candidatus Nanohaloarchaea archaeon]
MAKDDIGCGICNYNASDPNALWSHIRQKARHGDEEHQALLNRTEEDADGEEHQDKLEEMKEKAQDENESDVQLVETADKPADEPEYESIRDKDTENLTEKEKKYLLAALEEGYSEIEVAPEKDLEERDVR